MMRERGAKEVALIVEPTSRIFRWSQVPATRQPLMVEDDHNMQACGTNRVQNLHDGIISSYIT